MILFLTIMVNRIQKFTIWMIILTFTTMTASIFCIYFLILHESQMLLLILNYCFYEKSSWLTQNYFWKCQHNSYMLQKQEISRKFYTLCIHRRLVGSFAFKKYVAFFHKIITCKFFVSCCTKQLNRHFFVQNFFKKK